MFGLGSLFGGGGGGFSGSSEANSSSGAISVGGLNFGPSRTDTLITGAFVVVAVLGAVMLLKRK